jgi:hypothetical protein
MRQLTVNGQPAYNARDDDLPHGGALYRLQPVLLYRHARGEGRSPLICNDRKHVTPTREMAVWAFLFLARTAAGGARSEVRS